MATRAMPCRLCSLITGEICQTLPFELSVGLPTGVTVAGTPIANRGEVRSRRAGRSSSISPPRAMRNRAPVPEPTTWPGSTLRSSTRPAAGATMLSRPLRAQQLAIAAPRRRGRGPRAASRVAVSRSTSAVRDEPAIDQLQGAVEVGLGQVARRPARPRSGRPSCCGLLGLDRAVDHREHLAGADPVAGFDQHRDDASAFADRRRPAFRGARRACRWR